MAQTPTPQDEVLEALKEFDPETLEMYDVLMAGIEPDLTSENLATLDEKYRGETAEQKKARTLRYNEAFETFMTAWKAWSGAWDKIAAGVAQDLMKNPRSDQ